MDDHSSSHDLRIQLQRTGVRVVTICPGFVNTDLTAGNPFPTPVIIEADTAAQAIFDRLTAIATRSSPHRGWLG